jgi:hypothetical protein
VLDFEIVSVGMHFCFVLFSLADDAFQLLMFAGAECIKKKTVAGWSFRGAMI